ncbi:MAG TPA: PIN domain-containing protein [Polyangia bacterium]|nr:PIN domain-containing protein [Polyangia bacterium]
MTVVDTSVWIDFFRGKKPLAERLVGLLDADEVALPAPVRIEILSGAGRADRTRLARVLGALPVLGTTDATWARIERWVLAAGAVGHRFGLGDLLVASIAAEHGATIWSLDADFSRLAKLGFVTLAA